MEDLTKGYAQALAAASQALCTQPRAGLPMPGSASTLGDIAAHLVAYAAVRQGRGNPLKAVTRLLPGGVDAITRLSALTDDPHPDAPATPARHPVVKGRVGREWSLNSGFVHHYGHDWHLSGTMPGLFLTLPHLHPDLDEMGGRFREELARAGLPDHVCARGHARIGANPHGQDDGRPWTAFVLPMDDRRLDYVGSIVDLGHRSALNAQDSLRSYARQAAEVHENAASLSRMVDVTEDLCLEAGDEAPSLRYEGISLYAVSIGRGGKLKDAVVLHARFTGLSEALTEIPLLGVLTGTIGLTTPSTTNLPAMAKEQARRHRALARLGGPTIDRTGLDLLRQAGHDVDEMLVRLRGRLATTDTRVHAGTGTNAWMRISAGRITAAVDITPEARWKHDHLEIRRRLPESVLYTVAGRAATDIVGHPALEGATVRSARMLKGRALVSIEPRWEPLP